MDESAVVSPAALAGPLSLLPFRALHLAADRIGTAAGARAFAHPHDQVPRRIETWCRQGLAVQDETPALWLHEYTTRGMTVRGLVGALDLTRPLQPGHPGAVLPHERVLPTHVDELERRMGLMRMQPAPILLAHRAPPALRALLSRITTVPPNLELTDPTGQQHRSWALTDPDVLSQVAQSLQDARALIADGHHRYAAYLRLSASHGRTGPWSRGLAMLVDHEDTPLFLGAVHRLLRAVRLSDVAEAAQALGLEVTFGTRQQALAALDRRVLVLTDGGRSAWVRVPDERLAVDVLHHDLLPRLAGDGRQQPRVEFLHAAEQALAGAEAGSGTAVLLPALELDEVMDVLGGGALLPEKATSFQPKPSVGLLMRPVRDAADDPS